MLSGQQGEIDPWALLKEVFHVFEGLKTQPVYWSSSMSPKASWDFDVTIAPFCK